MTSLPAFFLTLARAAPSVERIDTVFADLAPSSPGCALAVAQDGKIVYERGYGTAD